MAARIWTLEQRQLQREVIHKWKPWERSTGPRSPDGKRKASRNAWSGGHRATLREVIKVVRRQVRAAREALNGLK